MSFKEFQLDPQIMAGITASGYTSPTPIQKKTIPHILAGKDVLGLAQTGTGKTAAFVLPILQRLLRGPRNKVRALIVAPTRELAEQINENIVRMGQQTGLKSVVVYGGVGKQPQL
jgi:ATP-dependent RNA helicase RhlE